ncbi:MAG TPA: hypothetical protein DCL15_12425 [Chloroflexi bacterium]|nr:hypothetical protein [Chloroflexota bacterium]
MKSQARTRIKPTNYQETDRIRIVKCIAESGDALSVTPGQYYRVLPDKAEAHGMLRVIDNTGEDYLYPTRDFEEIEDLSHLQTEVVVRLDAPTKAAILQIANQRSVSMSALVREWIEERVDLPATAMR